jgi:putative transposase
MASSPTEPAENLTPSDQSDASEANANPPPKLINRELSPQEQEKLNILSSISNRPKKERSAAIDEAAEKLGVNPRTIRRQLNRLQTEGVAVLATGRGDKGQYRITQAWRDFIIDLYKWGRREGSRRNIHQVYVSLEGLASQGEKLRDKVKKKKALPNA